MVVEKGTFPRPLGRCVRPADGRASRQEAGQPRRVVQGVETPRALITVRATSPPVYPSPRRGGLRGAGGRSTDAKIAANIDRGF
jgi:hypothetical protein